MHQVASALAYLHQPIHVHENGPRSKLHRDLKPANILLTNNRVTTKLADFGIATVQRTEITNMRGTVLWMAPEVMT
jgi:serine/threonine protein kinase